MKLYIKYMVSLRCVKTVREELEKIGIKKAIVSLGEVDITEEITPDQLEKITAVLFESGLEVMENKKAILIEKIKNEITKLIHNTDDILKTNFSDHLSQILNYNYTYLANLFSETEGITIEHFIILHRIERVKELIIYDELNLTEIAFKLHYSSVAHLSSQFKKVTGLTPSFFKSLKTKRRTMLERV